MQVTELNADGLKRDFKIVVPAGQIETRVQARIADIARTIRMPGFRPGKVPMAMVRKRYGSSVMGEVLEQAVNDGTQSALAERKLRLAAQPKVEITSFPEGGDLEFSVALEIMPEIVPMDFATIALEREKAQVPDSEVEETLKRIAESREASEPVSRAAKAGDTAVIDFVGRQDGTAFPGGSAEDYSLKLGSGSFIPGFEEQLIGAKAGDKVTVAVTFPEAYGNDALAGKGAEFEVTVKEVRQSVPAVLDDEMAKTMGLDSLDALKDTIRTELGRELDGIARGKVKRKLLDALAAGHDFAVPAVLVEHEFTSIWEQLTKDKEAGRVDPSDVGKSDEQLKTEYTALAERRVRLGLLLAEIGQKNNITVTEEDTRRALMTEARNYPGQEHLVFKYYKENPDALEGLRAPIYEEKIVDFILELAKVTDRLVSPEELRKDPDAETPAAAAAEAAADDVKAAKPKKKAAPKKKTAEGDA